MADDQERTGLLRGQEHAQRDEDVQTLLARLDQRLEALRLQATVEAERLQPHTRMRY